MKQKIFLILSIIIFLLSLGQSLGGAVKAIVSGTTNYGNDFMVYYRAAETYLAGGDIYAVEVIEENPEGLGFLYPPLALIFFLPVTLFSPVVALLIHEILQVVLLAVSIWLVFKLKNGKIEWSKYWLILAFCLQTFAFKLNLATGQVNILVLALCAGSFYLQQKNKLPWAGLLLALATGLKLFPIFLLPLYLWRRDWKFIPYYLGFLLIGNLLFTGALFDYFVTVMPNLAAGAVNIYLTTEQSLLTAAARIWGASAFNFYLAAILSALIYLLLLCRFRGEKENYLLHFLLLAVIIFARAPVWQHYLIYLLPVIIWWFEKNYLVLALIWTSLFVHVRETVVTVEKNPILYQFPWLLSFNTYLYLLVTGSVFFKNFAQWRFLPKLK